MGTYQAGLFCLTTKGVPIFYPYPVLSYVCLLLTLQEGPLFSNCLFGVQEWAEDKPTFPARGSQLPSISNLREGWSYFFVDGSADHGFGFAAAARLFLELSVTTHFDLLDSLHRHAMVTQFEDYFSGPGVPELVALYLALHRVWMKWLLVCPEATQAYQNVCIFMDSVRVFEWVCLGRPVQEEAIKNKALITLARKALFLIIDRTSKG
jgi:hypothetical protein